MNFSIIIPNYNGQEFLPDCLNSLLTAISKTKESKFEIILIDNNSKDNSILEIKKFENSLKIENCELEIIQNSQNCGFSPAVNQGIKKAKHEWVVLLNNDLTMNPDWFDLIIREFQKYSHNQKIATIFGTVLNKSGEFIESQGLEYFYRGKAKNINNGKPYLKSDICHLRSQFVWGASAALVIYKKDILQKIGLFDEDFFAYEEDVDVALRLHKLNYKTLFVPSAISYHLGGGTSNKMGNFRNRMDTKNWIYIIIKNYSLKEILSNFFAITEERLRNLSGLIKHTNFLFIPSSLIKTYGEVVLKLPKMVKKRRILQNLIKSN